MRQYIFGIDIGGTGIKCGCFSDSGTMLGKWEISTPKTAGALLKDVSQLIRQIMTGQGIAQEAVLGVGIGVPGAIDIHGRVVALPANVALPGTDLADSFFQELGFPVKIVNDANAAALGEQWQGAGKGCKNMVMVTLGTGVGGGIIVDGHIVPGAFGAGGEIGHIPVCDDEKEVCGCGQKGCLEQYASATGIVRLAERRLLQDTMPSSLRTGVLSAKRVFDSVKDGDAIACTVAEEFGAYLSKGLAMVAQVTDPELFVIGGGVSNAGDVILQYLKPAYEKRMSGRRKRASILLAKLGNDAGIFGAASLFAEEAR